MSEGGENKSGLSAIIVAIGLILTTVANIAGIMQLKDVSATVIVIVLTAGAIVLALYALSERKRSKTTAIWLTAGAIFCAVIALGTMALSFFGGESGAFKGPGIFTSDTSTEEKPSQETERTNQPSSSGNSDRNTSSSPSTSTRPVLEKEITLWLDTGVDIDAADVKAVKAQAAVGSTDIVLKYYGNLDGTAQGFYQIKSSDTPEATCRQVIDSGKPAKKEIQALAGTEYCLRTSNGNLASIQIIESTIIAFQPEERFVKLAIKVWSK